MVRPRSEDTFSNKPRLDEDDVEGHRSRPRVIEDESTPPGASRPRATDEDDVEGHRSRPRAIEDESTPPGASRPRATDEDDVEGHRFRLGGATSRGE